MTIPENRPQNADTPSQALFVGTTLVGGGGESQEADKRYLFPEVIGQSDAIGKVLNTVARVARSNSSVLILGESGTGKELIASAIHRLSTRSSHNFIAINCSAIPEELLEAELFGHEKGAFTGAEKRRLGHFGAADKGTIFLDEIGDMPARLQAKLLRVLQEKRYSPIGSSETKEADVRIVAATNVDLESAVKNQSFRLDLYYRLNVLPIRMPALRDRVEDLPLLLDHFFENAMRIHPSSQPCRLSASTLNLLKNYAWPGNIRQLQNLVERLVIMHGGQQISPEHLPEEILSLSSSSIGRPEREERSSSAPRFSEAPVGELPNDGIDLSKLIENLENQYILEALRRTGNNKNQAAKLLGLNRTTLVERIKKRQIDVPDI